MEKELELVEKFERLREEFETYQNFAESTIQIISEKNTKLEKMLDNITNIVEISKYINSNISDSNLISMINDMIIGISGVTYSSIYLYEFDKLVVKATNSDEVDLNLKFKDHFVQLNEGKLFIINSKSAVGEDLIKDKIHSIIGIPINLRDKFTGYIIVEHTLWNFFSQEYVSFISSIAIQIAITIENSLLYAKVKESSIRDPLLGIYNRKYFFDTIENKLFTDISTEFAIVMMDIDDFKKVNDLYGHQAGDDILLSITNTISENLHEEDIVARYGGEEIVIYIHEVRNYNIVYNRIDNIRKKITNTISESKNLKNPITASFGISYYKGNKSVDKVLEIADIMLYKAKASGKNRVVSE
ncbi:sensor domain-containing diguanylate cyclase [Clostridium tagluense]|uniref:sensor domain-containing diguanylate cyclase n=1 Tax=Clostridium TaxID=1485 RepID=UPI0013E9175E|nr:MULTISPECIES: sensor domain-containing diguanylate cyclase [Clostridium]MBU3126991.1 sensor domain-containing diguanylate cyclase [Clostridium tagluense]MBZ9625348.1 sensor domain-containing diguanylate cyclase [Clostridium sp. FP2]MCB2310992.1 sensor domain-containing diguanylate cyclase [Clostridium tagluense]MCB2316850.1 sensor domain-containing diguanylate cyclase [Clostridium tagluense]MCB2321768.1 sensor domain-containing diguanylate cyclase [Clostridium tagluense]